jgi:hypothetical protein
MKTTDYDEQSFVHELTGICSFDGVGKLAGALVLWLPRGST